MPATNRIKKLHGYIDGRRKFTVEDELVLVVLRFMHAGALGCTPADLNMRNMATAVYQLRKMGVVIETGRMNDPAGCPGLHLRYILRSAISITEVELEAFHHAA